MNKVEAVLYFFVFTTDLVCFFTCRRVWNARYLRMFPVYGLLSLITEGLGLILRYTDRGSFIQWQGRIYECFMVFEALFFYLFFRQLIKSKLFLSIQLVIIILFFGYVILSRGNFYFPMLWNTDIGFFENLVVLPIPIFYLYECSRQKSFLAVNNQPSVWIAFGVLFYFLVSTPVFLAYKFLALDLFQDPEAYVQLFSGIPLVVMQITFLAAFLCNHPKWPFIGIKRSRAG